MRTHVVLPTYNEAANLARLVEAIVSLRRGLRIVVVDDASPDGTGALADTLAGQHSELRVIHRLNERGLGTAYLAGFREALAQGADAILTMDCDFSHDPATIPELLATHAAAALVIGSRYVPGGRIEGWPPHRRLLSKSANAFVRALFSIPANDCTSGFRLYSRAVIEEIPWPRVRSTGYSFLVETLYWATRKRQPAEVPICYRERAHGKSKLGWREAVYGARNLIRLRLETRR